MTINDRMQLVLKSKSYKFCGIIFSIYDTDKVRIYDNDTCIYDDNIINYKHMSEDLKNKVYFKEVLIKLPKDNFFDKSVFAICFYINKVDAKEHGISMRHNYI